MNSEGGDMSGGGTYPFNAMTSGHIDWACLAQQWIQMRDNVASTTKDVDAKVPATGLTYAEEKGESDMDMDDEQMDMDNNDRNIRESVMQQFPANDARSHWFTDSKDNAADMGTEAAVTTQRCNNKWSKWASNQMMPTTSVQANRKRQLNTTAHIPSLLKINVPHPNEIRTLPDGGPPDQNSSSNLDAAKRKGLPAWIREGLEKMEREKQRHQEKQTNTILSDDNNASPTSSRKVPNNSINLKPLANEQEESDEVDLVLGELSENCTNEKNMRDGIPNEEEVVTMPQPEETYEQKLAKLMVVVRETLTELLLECTNEEISKIAHETIKSYKMKASSAQVIHNNSALSSITGKLGLAVYGDSSDDYSEDEDDDGDNNSKTKTILSESNDSEEDIKIALRLKKRSFIKTASEIEERVSAAAAREAEKIKYFIRKEEAESSAMKCKKTEQDFSSEKREMVTNESVSECSDKIVGNINERDSGETTETKLQNINGKRQRDRGTRRERTTRFSDNRDNRYVTIAATATYIADVHSKGNICSTTTAESVANQGNSTYSIGSLGPKYIYTGIFANNLKPTDPDVDVVSKNNISSNKDNERDRKEYKYDKRKREHHEDRDSSPARSLSRSSTSSSSSSSSSTSTSESSTSRSSYNSKYSHRSASKHSSPKKKNRRSEVDKYGDRKHYSSYSKRSRKSSYSRHHHSDSSDDDPYISRRKHGSRYYSSSHYRSHNSSRSHRDTSRSNSRSSYTVSGKRRQ